MNALKHIDEDHSASRVMGMVACWAGLVITMLCNWLFEYLRLGGVTMMEVSNQVFSWFTPANFAFNFWNVVYAALIVWLVLESTRVAEDRSLDEQQIALFLIVCVLNVLGLTAYHLQHLMIALLMTATLWLAVALLYTSLRDDPSRSRLNLAPFSLYFGWVTVAGISAATHVATRVLGASLAANQASTLVLAVAVLVVAFLSVRKSNDYVFPIAVIWGNIGIGVRLMGADVMVATVVLAITTVAAMVIYIPSLLAANRTFSSRLRASG